MSALEGALRIPVSVVIDRTRYERAELRALGVPDRYAPVCRCSSAPVELFKYEFSDGSDHYTFRCTACPEKTGLAFISKARIAPEALCAIDTVTSEALEAARKESFAAHRAPPRPSSDEWWEAYDNYLNSPAWKAKRHAVLERDRQTCRSADCGDHATEVHHLSYPVGCLAGTPEWDAQETLEILVAICHSCHEDEHGRAFGLGAR
jgi:hypothetical protein